MIQRGRVSFETREPASPKSVISSSLSGMDVKSPKCLTTSSVFPSQIESPFEANSSFYANNDGNPFADTFPDPLCKLNLKETSDFVKAFPMARNGSESRGFLDTSSQKRREGASFASNKRFEQAPPTPGRPVFSFSVGNLSRKAFPSKWDDAEKWLISSSCHESPAHDVKQPETSKASKQNEIFQHRRDMFDEKFGDEAKVSGLVACFGGSVSLEAAGGAFQRSSSDVLLKDKFTDNVEPVFPKVQYSEPTQEGFLFGNSGCEAMKDASTEVTPPVEHRDVGTEMTPLGSSTTSRCHTPFKSSSPARHNTPTTTSGPLVLSKSSIDMAELHGCHFAKLELGSQFDSVVSNWSSREEEEEEVSKSLRHFEMDGGRKSVTECRASLWEEEERSKSCIRYQREEAKIQAWVNLQTAKAEAQSRKLEVKIQKMRANLEEKLMKRMAVVHRKAEEWRVAGQLQHSQQIQKAAEQAEKMKKLSNSYTDHSSCGCFPCNSHL
ncbi:hypothetical protein H6P81_004282 [Aristolochia fimbriata]|uniref:Remorin C-terminal domain-containing protein n=1 Tax=Aristolochia fimbriata TaxID=158543 RepID=A0AAV7FGQ4_ARIFI|nr:hypothetical protein H6P81_004282 [Aristolochia fimbriata]